MDYPLLNAFWTMCLIFLWVMWLILLFRIIGDIFRSHDLKGWGKTGWLVLVILLPFLGVFIYVIARGHGMSDREIAQAERQQKQLQAYLRETVATGDETGLPRGFPGEARRAEEPRRHHGGGVPEGQGEGSRLTVPHPLQWCPPLPARLLISNCVKRATWESSLKDAADDSRQRRAVK